MKPARTLLARLAVAMVLVLSACGGGSESAAEPAGDQAVTAEESLSPLEVELGFSSEPGQRQLQLIEMQEHADGVIVECMKGAGFFYAVNTAEDRLRAGAFAGDGTRTWVEANGFGITRLFITSLLADQADEVVGDADVANQEFVGSLTPDQTVAYDTALLGQVTSEATGEFVPAGCWGDAYTDVVRAFSLLDEFGPDLDTLNSRIKSDPRFQEFQRMWSSCMETAGYFYATEQSLVDDVYAQLLAIDLVEVAGATRVASQDALNALQSFELETGTASFDCRQAFAEKADDLRVDYELEFLNDNRFRLEEILEPAD